MPVKEVTPCFVPSAVTAEPFCEKCGRTGDEAKEWAAMDKSSRKETKAAAKERLSRIKKA